MGREVRKVPKNWRHPKDKNGHYQPLYDGDFETAAAKWKDGLARWEAGTYEEKKDRTFEFWEWEGNPPKREYYRPRWSEEERTHFQMYEATSEGTPISPVMDSPESLARWLADNGANAGAGMTASYEQWLLVCNGVYAPSMIFKDGKIMSGVAGL